MDRQERKRLQLIQVALYGLMQEDEDRRKKIQLITPENEEYYYKLQQKWIKEHGN